MRTLPAKNPFALSKSWGAAIVALAASVIGAGSVAADEAEPKAFEMTVFPAAEPVPALKYHLLPPLERQVPGNAAPIYMRLMFERAAGEWHQFFRDEPQRLLKFPIAELPLEDAEKTLQRLSGELEQISAAGLRTDCDWSYVLGEDPLLTLIPDAQSMRSYGRLLALQGRYHVRQGEPLQAIASLHDGLALARHVARAPFLVNQLVGAAVAGMMLDELDEIVQLEHAPNLYWALAALPNPLISFDAGLATEGQILQLRFPELSVPNASIDWAALAPRMREWAVEIANLEGGAERELLIARIQTPPLAEQLERAKSELPSIGGYSTTGVDQMSNEEIEVRYTLALYQLISDSARKWYCVPYFQSAAHASTFEKLRTEAQTRELYPLVSILTPLHGNLLVSQAASGRQVARLQLVNALRMHAAATGKLPETLPEVRIVPVPRDPGTGQEFTYRLDGNVATIDVVDLAGMQRDRIRFPLKLTLGKRPE